MDMIIRNQVQKALEEDAPWGDITSELLIPVDSESTAHLTSKSNSVVCGNDYFIMAFLLLDEMAEIEEFMAEGEQAKPGDIVMTIKGNTRKILQAERIGLNYFCHMSGIATEVRKIAILLDGTDCNVVDTRKTLPHLRHAQKHAVKVGGGVNHRMDLSSAILIKDNHILAVGGVTEAVSRAKDGAPHVMKVEVEVKNKDEAKQAIAAGADILLLDNMTPDEIEEILELVPEHVITEASGGINPTNCRAYAESGVDVVSMGWLTHTVKNADFSLEFE